MKKSMTKIAPLALACGFAAGAAAGPAIAEEVSNAIMEQIVVTASKREESLMDAAQSVQFLSGEELWNVGFTKLDDVVQLIPGVSLPSGTASIRTYNIRGTGAMTTNDSPVGFYIDQMPYYIVDYPYAPDSELFDLDSVQVLRGPQGTLYGQGAMGGTMLITTMRPDLERVRARVRAGMSSMRDGGDGHMADASLSFPLIPGEMAMSITAGTSRDPGLAEGFDVPGSDLDKDDRWYGRVKLYWEASDLVSVTAMYHHRDVESSGSRGTYLSADPALLSPSGGSLGGTDFEVDMFGITVDWDTNIGTLTSSTSYLEYKYLLAGGLAFEDPFFGTFLSNLRDERDNVDTFNQEFRLASNGDGPWSWITGVTYTKGQHVVSSANETILPALFAGTVVTETDTESTQFAVFGEISHEFKNGLITPLVGLRYFRDDREKMIQAAGFTTLDQDEVFDLVSPRFNLRITPSDDTMYFLNVSRGFRSGTFNAPADVVGLAPLGIALDVAVPEATLWSYEVGARLSLLEGQLLMEPSLYYADYDDFQFSGTVGLLFPQFSLEEVVAKGVEMIVTWNTPTQGLSLTWAGSLNSSETTSIDAVTDANLIGVNQDEQLPFVPEWDFRLGVNYEWSVMNDWTASVLASFYRRDGQRDFITPMVSPNVEDLSLRLELANQNWRATLWSKNLTDDKGPAAISAGLVNRWDRRTVGVTLEYTMD